MSTVTVVIFVVMWCAYTNSLIGGHRPKGGVTSTERAENGEQLEVAGPVGHT